MTSAMKLRQWGSMSEGEMGRELSEGLSEEGEKQQSPPIIGSSQALEVRGEEAPASTVFGVAKSHRRTSRETCGWKHGCEGPCPCHRSPFAGRH